MIRVVAGKELRTLWCTPVPFVVGALFHLVVAVLFVNQIEARRQALVQPLFPIAGFLLLAMVPVIAMRSLAEEERSGTLDLLEVAPVTATSIVVGKWLGCWLTVLAVVLPVALVVPLLELLGRPDIGPATSGFIGLAFFTAALTGIGVLASSLTTSQPVAAMVGLSISLVLWFAHVGSSSLSAGGVLDALSISERLRQFAGGVIDSSDVVFFTILAAASLVAATVVVSGRRLR
ncbi:MAG: hypothetical protein NVS3B21_21020 [Acidimicrobiales bacterium]